MSVWCGAEFPSKKEPQDIARGFFVEALAIN